MIADSDGSVGAWPLFWISATWFRVMIAADYRMLPVIIRADQCSGAVVQFQGGISQCIGNIIWRRTELRAYGTNNHSLWPLFLAQ